MCAKQAVHQSAVVLAKREAVKKKIVKAVTPLFLEKGFDKTTIKDIETVTNLKAGSIYNLFENKSEILRECSILVYNTIIKESRRISENDVGSLRSVSYPFVLELFSAANDPIIASLLKDGRNSEHIDKSLSRLRMEIISEYLSKHNRTMDAATIEINLNGLSGAIGNYVASYNTRPHKDCRAESLAVMTIFCALFGQPGNGEDVTETVDSIITQLKKGNTNLVNRLMVLIDEPSE